ncbi:hypothetical protein [Spirosoma litoris]
MKDLMITLDHVANLVWNHTLEGSLDGLNNYFTCVTPVIDPSLSIVRSQDCSSVLPSPLKKTEVFLGRREEVSPGSALAASLFCKVDSMIFFDEGDIFLDNRNVLRTHDNSRDSAENYPERSEEQANKQKRPILIGVGSSGLRILSEISHLTETIPGLIIEDVKKEYPIALFGDYNRGKSYLVKHISQAKGDAVLNSVGLGCETVLDVRGELVGYQRKLRYKFKPLNFDLKLNTELEAELLAELLSHREPKQEHLDPFQEYLDPFFERLKYFYSELNTNLSFYFSGIGAKKTKLTILLGLYSRIIPIGGDLKYIQCINKYRSSIWELEKAIDDLYKNVVLWDRSSIKCIKFFKYETNWKQKIEEKLSHLINGFSIRMNVGNLIPSHEGASAYHLL